ncbi:glutathione S-transferase family protein [Roseibium sediminis]|uniref:glutathione S-transferase family protein n=1 Tax=Roseibium sediminis TaxID=1775174 RepID=UPI0013762917|nr:glutathione S-transferase family protein [Roseibium sediminis]
MTQVNMTYQLYGSPDSANLVIRLVLEILHVPYEYVAVDRSTQAHKSKAYLAMNPQGLLPVLVDPDQDAPLFETAAILLHLADKHGGLAPDVAAPARGRFLKWLLFLSNTVQSDLRISFRPERYTHTASASDEVGLVVAARVQRHFELLEQEIARSGGPFLLGSKITVLDPYLASCARWAQLYMRGGTMNIGVLPGIKALCERLQAMPEVLRATALEGLGPEPFTHPSRPDLPGITD